ncbi:class Ib ribonucleoside-diphosphate reductase assembly flavoprotein NrdI [Dolosicoccus paucivorans]|uniref:Class Ib ribonucleoside-diphosphate reductase assembly flavoprotein NrdI n=1 Tax=Dolosicoccus paucivorans TaxID=84521 RepID=A0A1G8IJZ4_9LACT|nr:class Ib ribonucleoside-diphosphate reductase assembly flavoprotein NrdI [Dolosicoccus paucivorans]PMB84938.1 class Ib ribonucleoside-diphosphate reductase assembly flavoprotein NrdI [Dolosicoccus paucivorans]PMC58709.1 class Ib ribonucleoside-diphosphate reductase assembly flavoprotein NrdI [Dolosicoccus paucivorans]SDI19358.1 protein involved in ribonucleotide reduction [Dolosicoccus paucivorans]
MLVVYMTMTGQTRRFVNKLDLPSLEITQENMYTEINKPFIIIVPTYQGEATDIMYDLLETGNNAAYFKGVAGGGNLNFGTLFCYTAKDIARDFNVPLLHMFEFQGNDKDVKIIKEKVQEIGSTSIEK